MPDGACVIRYDGARGVRWKIKFRDVDGWQVKETLGRAADGWNRRKAEAELRARLVAVEREGYVKPEPSRFAAFASVWLGEYGAAKALTRSTKGYEIIVAKRLHPHFGAIRLAEVGVEHVERFIVAKRREGLSPASINRQLNVLSLVLKAAVRRGHLRANPVALIDRPREARRRWRIFTPAEVGQVERAFDELIASAPTQRERDDQIVVRRLFLTHMGTGIRRGEAAGLRWRSVLLADPDGPVMRIEETFVRHRTDTPKSAAGHRTISLGARLAAELWEHRRWTPFEGDDELVFANPRTGRPFDANRYAELYRSALGGAGIDGYVRPSHDLRHSSITNAAAAGTSPEALMSRAGHSSYATTRRYVDLAGERFREEADRLEARLLGGFSTKNRYQVASDAPNPASQEAE